VGDLPGKLTGKSKTRGSGFGPTTNAVFRRNSVKRRIHFNGGEILGIKLQPMGLWQIVWIKDTPPVLEAPGARADADFLLFNQIQMESRKYSLFSGRKDLTSGEEECAKNLTGWIS
jgi:hypothetical protein